MQRAGTGYMDGLYDFPSGHVEAGETVNEAAARELFEETQIKLVPEDLELFHTYIHEVDADKPYLGMMFRFGAYGGDFVLNEPDKASDVAFFSLDNLPKVTPEVSEALKSLGGTVVTHTIHH